MTTADLIRSGGCTSACIAATTAPTRCTCPCTGEFHGLLAHAHLDTLIDGRRRGLRQLTDLEVISA